MSSKGEMDFTKLNSNNKRGTNNLDLVMDIGEYILPTSDFPRVQYMYKRSLEVYKKNKDLEMDSARINVPICHEVRVHLCKFETEQQFPVEIKDVLEEGTARQGTDKKCNSLREYLRQIPKIDGNVSVVCLNADVFNKTKDISNDEILFVTVMEKETHRRQKMAMKNCIVTHKEHVRTDIINGLEKLVLEPMKALFHHLMKLRESFDRPVTESDKKFMKPKATYTKFKAVSTLVEPTNGYTCTSYKGTKHAYSHMSNISSADNLEREKDRKEKRPSLAIADVESKEKKRKLENRPMLRKLMSTNNVSTRFCQHTPNISKEISEFPTNGLDKDISTEQTKDKVDDILKSIKVLFNMSNIPSEEQPNFLSSERPEIVKVCEVLFKLSKCVRGAGYNYNTLYVYISEKLRARQATLMEKKIKNALQQVGVTKYEIVKIAEEIEKHMLVGAKLEPVPGYGTLGCFAKMETDTDCILVSSHVAQCGGEMYFEGKRKVCRVLKETLAKRGELDIAAAQIFEHEKVCSTNFKNSEGKSMKGRLLDYENDKKGIICDSQEVYIWGATSKPGKGIIKVRKAVMTVHDRQHAFIHIDDVDDTKAFSKEGDSGAIVCTDDPDGKFVHAFGMVMGCHADRDNGTTLHLALPLSEGIKQLERKTGKIFEIF